MNLLGTHDTERILTVLGEGDNDLSDISNDEFAVRRLSASAREKGIALQKLAATVQYTVYGVPSVFYGDEAGVEGFGDPFCRRTFPWGRECTELFEHYKKLGALRVSEPLFKDGEFRVDYAEGAVIAYSRYDGKNKLTVVVNASDEPVRYSTKHTKTDLLTCAPYTGTLPPLSAVVLK